MKVKISEDESFPDYSLYGETVGYGHLIEIDHELYERYTRVSKEYDNLQKELRKLYEEIKYERQRKLYEELKRKFGN